MLFALVIFFLASPEYLLGFVEKPKLTLSNKSGSLANQPPRVLY